MSDTYTHPPHGMSEYDSLMIDDANVDPRAVAHELADDPDLYIQATEDLETTAHEYDRVAEENYATLMSGGEPTDDEGEREATLRHKTEVLRKTIDPTPPDPIEARVDLNSPEEQRKTQRAAHELQGLVADLINDIRIDYFAKNDRMRGSDEHAARREKVADILREYPGLSSTIEQRLGQYKKSDEAHWDSGSHDDDTYKKGKLTEAEDAYIAARDKDLDRDPFTAMTTVAEIKVHIEANKAEGRQVKSEEYSDLDSAIYGGVHEIMHESGYYNYDKGQGKDAQEFYKDDIERENAAQEKLYSEMVEAVYEWRESGGKENEAVVYSKMIAMHEHMTALNRLAEDVPLRHSYHDTLRSQRENMMRNILTTRYMRDQVRVAEAAQRNPGAMDFSGRLPVGFNADKSIALGGINIYPDGVLGIPSAGGTDKDGNPITLYIHPDGKRTETKIQPFPMEELPTVTNTRRPEPEVPPIDTTGMNMLERRRAVKAREEAVEARKQRELAHLQEIADGKIMEDDRDIATLLEDYNEADRNWFVDQSSQEAIEELREVLHVTRQRVSEAMHAELGAAYPDEDSLAEMQRITNVMTYRLNFLEANHTDKKYAMGPDGTIATRDTMNQRTGYWMIRPDGSARQVTRDRATGRPVHGRWMPPTGDYIAFTY